MALRDRLRRLKEKAQQGAVLVYQKDGSVRGFDLMEVYGEMFMAQMDLFKDNARESPVLDAVRSATPESRKAFEERFGPIAFTSYVIGYEWVDARTLTEDGRLEKVRYEGEEAERIRELVRSGASDSQLHEELPRPPEAGRWPVEPIEDLSE